MLNSWTFRFRPKLSANRKVHRPEYSNSVSSIRQYWWWVTISQVIEDIGSGFDSWQQSGARVGVSHGQLARERGHTFLTAAGFGWSYYYQVWVCLVQRLHSQPSTCVCVDCVVVSAALVVLIVTEDIKVCITSNTSIQNNKIITFSSFQNSL